MPTDTTVNNLVINKLTKAQYEAIQNPSDTEIYLVPDVIDTAPISGSDNMVTSGGVYTALSNKADTADLATVATSGSYTDLDDKPTIPTVPSNIVTGTSSSYTIWVGTQAQYEDISTKDATTIYLITES